MLQDYRIYLTTNYGGQCSGPQNNSQGYIQGTVSVCPGSATVTLSCYQNHARCTANSTQVTINPTTSCASELPVASDIFVTSAQLSCPCDAYTCAEAGADSCPAGQQLPDGCGNSNGLSCGTDCTPYPLYQCIEGSCTCVDDCTGIECGTNDCGQDCGSCPDSCETCQSDNTCGPYSKSFYFSPQPPNAYELGTNEPLTARIRYRRFSSNESPLQISIVDVSNGNAEYPYGTIDITYHCSIIQDADVEIDVEQFFAENNLQPGTYKIRARAADGNPTLNSININITDDDIPGCDDECASNTDEDATTNDGTCNYSACLDTYANNYICGGGCSTSYYCGGVTTDYNEATDDGSCTFTPIAFIDNITDPLYEGNEITLKGQNSVAITPDSDYGTPPTITEYSWDVFDTEGRSWNGTGNQLTFPIPLYLDTNNDYGGGGVITAQLTVTNSNGFYDMYERDFTIGDIDILGTELNAFLPIYIPGGDNYTLIGCYLPPNDGDGYSMGELLDASFFIENPAEVESPTPNIFMTGDLAYILLGGYDDEDEERGFYNYITGVGWIGPDITLKPGMGIKLQTENAGWFRWTLPE